jgi:hypothetical protein
MVSPLPSPLPPPPPAPPTPPTASPPLPLPPIPVPPPPVPPPPAPRSITSQPQATHNPAPDTHELDNTLEKLRALQKQERPPVARANPLRGGAPDYGGSRTGDVTATLSAVQQGAIGDKVRECWDIDRGALGVETMSVQLIVTFDENGTARVAEFGPADSGRVGSDPRFRAFAERARRAVLDPRCANLPIPPSDLGRTGTLTFRFKP